MKIKDNVTGKTIEVPWDKPEDPTQEDLADLMKVYGPLGGMKPVTVDIEAPPEEKGWIQRGAEFLTKPIIEHIGGAYDPGKSEEEQRRYADIIIGSLPKIPSMMDPIMGAAYGPAGYLSSLVGRKLPGLAGRYGSILDVASLGAGLPERFTGEVGGRVLPAIAGTGLAAAGGSKIGTGIAERDPLKAALGAVEAGLGVASIPGMRRAPGVSKPPSLMGRVPPGRSTSFEALAPLDIPEIAPTLQSRSLPPSQLVPSLERPSIQLEDFADESVIIPPPMSSQKGAPISGEFSSLEDFVPSERELGILPDFPQQPLPESFAPYGEFSLPPRVRGSSSILPEELLPPIEPLPPSQMGSFSTGPMEPLENILPRKSTVTGQFASRPRVGPIEPESREAARVAEELTKDLPLAPEAPPRLVKRSPKKGPESGGNIPPEEKGFEMKDTVTVWHGKSGASGASEMWGSTNPERAASFGGEVSKVEIPKDIFEEGMKRAREAGSGTYGDVILPPEYIKQMQAAPEIKERVFELSDVEGLEDLKGIPGLEDINVSPGFKGIRLGDLSPSERGAWGENGIIAALKDAGMTQIKRKGDIISWKTLEGESKSINLKQGRIGLRQLGLSPRQQGMNLRNIGQNPRSPLPGFLRGKGGGEEGYITLDALGVGGGGKGEKGIRKARLTEKIADFTNIPRTTFSGIDISMPFRQGALYVFRNPLKAIKASKQMFRALASEEGFQNHTKEILSRPNAHLYMRDGLAITKHPQHAGLGDISEREEFAISTLASRIPGIKQSNRAAVSFLNEARVNRYDDLAEKFSNLGLHPEDEPAFYKQVARYVNMTTGRGDLGKKGEVIAPLLQTMLFSPRFLMSRVQSIGHAAPEVIAKHLPEVLTGGTKFPPALRGELRKDLAAMAGVWGSVLTLAAAIPGVKVELDPRSADWLKIKYKNTRLDMGAGYQQLLRYSAQAITGERKGEEGKIEPTGGREGRRNPIVKHTAPILRFGRSKLAPYPGLAATAYEGRTFTGEPFDRADPEAYLKEILSMHTPGALSDVIMAGQDAGLPGAAMGSAGFLGGSVTTHNKELQRKNWEKFKQIMAGAF